MRLTEIGITTLFTFLFVAALVVHFKKYEHECECGFSDYLEAEDGYVIRCVPSEVLGANE